jgi:NAD+ synthase (glutamine-hydrolysing)
MTIVRVAAASLNQTPLAWDENADHIRRALDSARAAGASLVCLPELCISGYGCEDAFLWPGTRAMALRALGELMADTRGLVVSLGLPLDVAGRVVNAAALVVDGRLIGIAAKRHLAREGLHYEPRWFLPWPKGEVSELELFGERVPVGDLVFEVGGVRLGFEICEDAWVAERPGQELAASGVELVLNPSASHFAFGKHMVRRRLVEEGVRQFRTAYVYANLLGNEAGRAIYDGDLLIAEPDGSGGVRIVAEGSRLSFDDVGVAVATLDLPRAESASAARRLVTAPFAWPASPELAPVTAPTAMGTADGELDKAEAFARVLGLGLFDYLRKSRSRGFVVSLSGGADSATVATLVRILVELGSAELGLSRLCERLGPFASGCQNVPELVSLLLTTVYQATENSSEVTRRAAAEVARALGATHHEVSVQSLLEGYGALATEVLGRPLAWASDDIALQNLQARVRAPLVWLLANVRGALLLSTSNRSEAAVGYATMDGDTSGGLAPIAGIDKAYLRRWLLHVEQHGVAGLAPVLALRLVNEQAPTAELRPPGSGQTDEADLMPYELLDVVERLVIVARLSVSEVLAGTLERFPEYAPPDVRRWVERFYRLFARNQWKRERYAPSFHLDDANLDPKTWCRFPILSGGFERELAELVSAKEK